MARLRTLDKTDDSPVSVPQPAGGEREYETFDCPSCGFPICEWTECPQCGWFHEEIWEITSMRYSFGDHAVEDREGR